MSGPGDGWPEWDDDGAASPPHPAPAQQAPPPGRVPPSGLIGIQRLVFRHFSVIVAAVVIVVAGAAITGFTAGGTSVTNRSSDAELCSAYSAAERSWNAFSTDATEITRLGAVARRHSDEDIRGAGQRLGNLSGIFSYGTYASIARPIENKC